MLHSSEFFSSCRPKRLSQGRALVPESSSESSEPGKSLVYSILYKCSKLEPGGVLRSPILLNCVLTAYLSAQSQLAAGLKSPQLDQMLAMALVMFQSLAGRCQVPEDDYYLLLAQGVTAPEEFFFKIPNEAALESWIVGTLYLQTGTSDDHGNFASQPRNSTLSVEEFTRSDITAALRRLWYISKEMANNDLKNMANKVSGQGMDSTRRKPSVPYINELRSQAASRGVTDKSDRDKVGNLCLIAIVENFRVISGKFCYQDFEAFTSQEEEDYVADGTSGAPTNTPTFKFFVSEGSQVGVTSEGDASAALKAAHKQIDPVNFDLIADTFALKEKGHDVAQVCLRGSMAELHSVYLEAMKATPQLGFRSVTFNEVRRLDKVMSKDIFKFLSRGEGSYDDGLMYYLRGDGKNNVIWKLLEAQFENAPDRGSEGPPASLRTTHGLKRPSGDTDIWKDVNSFEGFEGRRKATAKPKSRPPGSCSVCWLSRDLHFKRAFCERSGGQQQKSKTSKGGSKGGKGAPSSGVSKGSSKGSNVPSYMRGHAVSDSSKKHPQGRKFCFNFHDPNGKCANAKCAMSHRCPVYKQNGDVCQDEHAQYEHKVDVHG